MTEEREALPVRGVTPKTSGGADERLASTGWFVQLLRRPESGVVCGLIATLLIFAMLPGANALYSLQGSLTFLTLAAELGIIAAAVALLIIAAGLPVRLAAWPGF